MTKTEQDLEDITVKVPAGRIAEFYEMHGRWLRGEPSLDPGDADIGEIDRLPWDPEHDLELAKKAWALFPNRAQLVFTTLIDNPGKPYSGDDLAAIHDIPNGRMGLAGVLAWPGRYLYKLGRVLPAKVVPNPEGGSWYSMEPDLAELFKEARNAF
jgi:hypothetical protein